MNKLEEIIEDNCMSKSRLAREIGVSTSTVNVYYAYRFKGMNMAYEQKDLTGVIFKNDKQGNENRPDYTGNITISGHKLWLSGWIKQSETKGPYISLSFKFADTAPVAQKSVDEVLGGDGVLF